MSCTCHVKHLCSYYYTIVLSKKAAIVCAWCVEMTNTIYSKTVPTVSQAYYYVLIMG